MKAVMVMLLAVLLSGVAAAQSTLLVVDEAGGPGSQFTSIAAAVNAAADGSTILVRAGHYGPFVVDGLTLVIVAEPGAEVHVAGDGVSSVPVVVRNVGPAQVVVLEDLRIESSEGHGVLVQDCGGQVWLQECLVNGGFGGKVQALHAEGADQLIVTRCELVCLAGGGQALEGAGLAAIDSRVFVYESLLRGGASQLDDSLSGSGAYMQGGFLFLEGSTVQGGAGLGEPLFPPGSCFTVKSGDGLDLLAGARGISLDTVISAGVLLGSAPGCFVSGDPVFTEGGASYQSLPGPSVSFAVSSPNLDGVPAVVDVSGTPGDVPVILVATAVGPTPYVPKYQGAIVTGNPFIVVLGPIPPSGSLSLAIDLGDVLAAGTGSTIFLQGGVLKATGGGLLADPVTLTTYEE